MSTQLGAVRPTAVRSPFLARPKTNRQCCAEPVSCSAAAAAAVGLSMRHKCWHSNQPGLPSIPRNMYSHEQRRFGQLLCILVHPRFRQPSMQAPQSRTREG